MRALYIGFLIPDATFAELLSSDGGMPAQTHRFGWSVAQAAQSAGISVEAVSAEPAVDFPHNRRLFFRGFGFSERDVNGTTVSFINVPGLKHVTRYFGALRAIRRIQSRSTLDVILVHGLHSPFLWAGIRTARKLGIPVAVILTDPPSRRTQFDSFFSSLLKRLDIRLIKGGLSKVDGTVALTTDLARDFAPGVQSLLLEGIARPFGLGGLANSGTRSSTVPNVVYAGGLSDEYGVSNLLDAVAFSDGEWTLTLFGKGPLEDRVRAATSVDPRIRHGGLVGPEELANAYAEASLLINPRPTTADFVRYSFPSKILEYMASGTPVMTTNLEGIPPDYNGHVIWTSDSARQLANSIDAVFRSDDETFLEIGASAQQWVLASKGVKQQGRRLHNFLLSLVAR